MVSNKELEEVAHKLVTNNGQPARIYFEGGEITVPVSPCYERKYPKTETVECEYLDVNIDEVSVEDGGQTLMGVQGLHVPKSEWERVGLHKQWESDDVDIPDPFTDINYKLEIWGSRFDSDKNESLSHFDGIPEDSPVRECDADDYSEPPRSFDHINVYEYAVSAEDAIEVQGMDRLELGGISKVEILDELEEEPVEPDIEKRNLDVDFRNSTSRDRSVYSYSAVDEIELTGELLEAIFTINKYAKKFDKKADEMYTTPYNGAEARVFSLKKKGLYNLKSTLINGVIKNAPDDVGVERHILDGGFNCWCFYFEIESQSYSFHQPEYLVGNSLLEDVGVNPEEFESEPISLGDSKTADNIDWSLERALSVIDDTTGFEINNFLEEKTVVDYEWGSEIDVTFQY